MKTLYLIFSKLKMMIVENPFIFTMLCVGVLTCNIMFTYMYGIIMQVNERDGVADFYIYHREGEKLSVNEIDEKLSGYDYSADYYALLDASSCALGGAEKDIKLAEYAIRARNDVTFFYLKKGNIENLKRLNTVIVPYEIEELNIGDIIKLNGREYEVVGSSIIPSFIMSSDTFKANDLSPDMFALDVPAKTTDALNRNLPALLGSNYMTEKMGNQGLNENAMSTLIIIVIIYILCVLAFLYLMTYIYENSAYEFNIYEILGASRRSILFILGGVMFIILAVVSLASQFIHAAFYKSFFIRLNMFGEYIYTMRDYAVLFLVTLLSVYSFVFLYICVRVKKSAIVNARKFIS